MLLSNQAVYPSQMQCLLSAAGFGVKLVTGVIDDTVLTLWW